MSREINYVQLKRCLASGGVYHEAGYSRLGGGWDIVWCGSRTKLVCSALSYSVVTDTTAVLYSITLPRAMDRVTRSDDRTSPIKVTVEDKVEVLDLLLVYYRAIKKLPDLPGHPLEHAVSVGNGDLMRKLLLLGASPDTQCSDGDSILHLAAGAGNENAVRALLQHGANVHAAGRDGHTPLHLAAMNDNPRTVASLIAAGADVNVRSREDDTAPLDVAAITGSVAAIETLWLNGADVCGGNSDGYTALHTAASGDQVGAIKELLRGGANINAQDAGGQTPLHVAISEQNDDSVSALCALGADKNIPDVYGRTPLLVGLTDRDCYAVHALLDAGADVNLRQSVGDNDLSPLELVVINPGWIGLEDLLQHGADVNAADSKGRTILHEVAFRNQDREIDLLVRAGADVHAPDKNGQMPIHYAANILGISAARALLSHGARVNARDSGGLTPLHLAAGVSRDDSSAEMIDYLLRWGADEKAVDKDGDTPARMLGYYAREPNEILEDPSIDVFARHLLATAPEGRTWRRRGLAVMCRARLNGEQPKPPEQADGASRRACSMTTEKKAKVARVEGGGGDEAGSNGGRRSAHRGPAENTSLADDLEDVVAKVAGMAEEGVFRHVLTFM